MDLFSLLNYSYSFASWPPVIVGFCMLCLGIGVLIREKASQVSVAFGCLIFCAAAWLLSFGGIYSAVDSGLALRWAEVEHTGVVFIPSCLLYFTLIIVKRIERFHVLARVCFAVSFVFALALWCSRTFLRNVVDYPWGFYPQYGPLGTLFLVFFFLLGLGSLCLLYQKAYREPSLDGHQRRLKSFLLAFSVGLLGAVDFVACYGLDVYPIGYLPVYAAALILAETIWRYRFRDLTAAFAAPQILATMPSSLLVLDPDGTICLANDRACEFFEKTMDELQGSPVQQLLKNFFTPENMQTLRHEGIFRDRHLTVDSAGAYPRQLNVSVSAIGKPGGEPMGYICLALDVTKHQRAKEALRISEARFQKLVGSNIIGFMLVDLEGKVLDANEAFLKMLGYSREDLAQGLVGGPGLTPPEYSYVDQWMVKRLHEAGVCPPVEKEYVRKDGTRLAVLVGVVLLDEMANGECLCFVLDASERRAVQEERLKLYDELEARVKERTRELELEILKREQAEEALRNQSITDALTGLYNRRGFLVLAEQHRKLAQRKKYPLAVFMMDLDGLKPINDTLGHQEGDRVLTQAGALIKSVFRESDVVARIGGDEFAVVAIENAKATTQQFIDRLEIKLSEFNRLSGQSYALGISIGMAKANPGETWTLEQLMQKADLGLYAMKKNSRAARTSTPLRTKKAS